MSSLITKIALDSHSNVVVDGDGGDTNHKGEPVCQASGQVTATPTGSVGGQWSVRSLLGKWN